MYIDFIFTPLTIYLGLKKNNVGGAGLKYLLFFTKKELTNIGLHFIMGLIVYRTSCFHPES